MLYVAHIYDITSKEYVKTIRRYTNNFYNNFQVCFKDTDSDYCEWLTPEECRNDIFGVFQEGFIALSEFDLNLLDLIETSEKVLISDNIDFRLINMWRACDEYLFFFYNGSDFCTLGDILINSLNMVDIHDNILDVRYSIYEIYRYTFNSKAKRYLSKIAMLCR